MRRGSVFQLIAIGVLIGGVTSAIALLIPWLPPAASIERGRIDVIFWLVTGICIAIFAIVFAVSIFSYMKFRARPDDDSDGPPIHGHTGLEIAWTAVPFLLVIVLGVTSAVVLNQNGKARGANPNEVNVTAQQFAWSFEHPNGVTDGTLRIPVGRSTVLTLHARDVIHSFWVPEFGQKQDAVPGTETRLVITPKRTGTFPVICTELCGLGHSLMRSRVIVMSENAYARWLQEGEASKPASGEAIFNDAGCVACHTFAPAGATAKIGPDLGDLPDDPAFVRQSIVDPEAEITPGYQGGVMPNNFGDQLSAEQLDTLVQYLLGGSK